MRAYARHLQEACVTRPCAESPFTSRLPHAVRADWTAVCRGHRMEIDMIEPSEKRPFSEAPYSDAPYDSRVHRGPRCPPGEGMGGPLCAEAQADGVPCFELGRECETCERAYTSWARRPREEEE
jgi:hypothetical protein